MARMPINIKQTPVARTTPTNGVSITGRIVCGAVGQFHVAASWCEEGRISGGVKTPYCVAGTHACRLLNRASSKHQQVVAIRVLRYATRISFTTFPLTSVSR